MPRIPRDTSPESTLALLKDPYRFVSRRCRRHESDVFESRLMLQTTICMTGPEAAQLFYDPSRFIRSGAAPKRVVKTLFGQGGVQALDGEAHRHRKQMFMSLMPDEQIGRLATLVSEQWQSAISKWTASNSVVLAEELHEILTRGVCAWAGVPLAEAEVNRRTAQLAALFDDAGSVGPRHWRSRLARKRANHWIAQVVQQVRADQLHPEPQTALHLVAWHRDLDGELLSPHVAAVELINVLRPTVAVSVYITFVAHALHEHPECRDKLEADDGYTDLFVQEVRRFYPFFPGVLARVRQDFTWNGYPFPQGRRTILDLYGTNRDPRTWDAPDRFQPERFRDWNGSPFNFVPQGGGDHHRNHRCPGEWIATELMKVAIDFLLKRIRYDVPDQDLSIDYGRLPALPQSHFVIRNVR